MRRILAGVASVVLAAGAVAGQEGRSLPIPRNVTVDGVPAIPMAVVEGLAPYARSRQARLVAWHPVERRMVIVTAFGNVPQLHELRFPGGARTQITFFTDGVPPRPGAAFAPKAEYFVYQKDTSGGGEANQLFRQDFATGTATLITDGKSRNGVPVVSRSGLVAYESTRRDGKNRDLYIVNPADPSTTRLLSETQGSWTVIDWSDDEKALLAAELVSSSDTYLWRFAVPGGQRTLLTPKGGRPVRWQAAAFAPDSQSVYAAGNLNAETARVWRLAEGEWRAVTPAEMVVEGFALSADGKTMAVAEDTGTASRLHLLGADGTPRLTPAIPAGVISGLAWHPHRNEVAFNVEGARAFSDVYSVDATAQRVDRWTSSEMAVGNLDTLPDARVISWKSFDGLEISGILYAPPAAFTGPRPVIINVHGGPAERERPRNIGRSNYFRNELGIAIIYPNIRGSLGRGRSFEELDNGRLRQNAVKDIGALLDWIAAQPTLDKTRVMIAGPSYGGFVALASAIEYGDRLRAVNPAFGITDFPTFLESTDVSRQANRNAEYGDPADPETRAFLSRISPLTNASTLKVPVFIAAGAKDTRVPVSQAEMLVKALKANGTTVWYVRFEDAGHLELTPATNDFSLYTWIMFVRTYLIN
jgi:dipeptidyl aminopeptidase/acylaminoacyl peptidase